MQKKRLLPRLRQWLYTKTGPNTATVMHSTHKAPATVSNVLYRSIHELPLYAFIKCDLKGDLSHLIISGRPDNEEVQAAWSDILSEFHEAIGETSTTMRLFLYREILLLRINLTEVNLCMKALRSRYHPFFHNKLNLLLECIIEMGTDPSNEQYSNALERYSKRTKNITMLIRLKESQLEAMNKNEEDQPKTTQAYYDNVLITLTDFAKVPVTDQVTTYVYCERVRRLNAYVKSQKK